MDATVENVTKDGTADVKVTLPDDATGNITVTVDGQTYVVPANGGKCNSYFRIVLRKSYCYCNIQRR